MIGPLHLFKRARLHSRNSMDSLDNNEEGGGEGGSGSPQGDRNRKKPTALFGFWIHTAFEVGTAKQQTTHNKLHEGSEGGERALRHTNISVGHVTHTQEQLSPLPLEAAVIDGVRLLKRKAKVRTLLKDYMRIEGASTPPHTLLTLSTTPAPTCSRPTHPHSPPPR